MEVIAYSLVLALVVLIVLSGQRAAAAGVKVGIKGVVYRNTGTYGSPTWTACPLIRDVTPNFPWDMVDASVRGSRAKLYAKTQIDLGAQVVMRADDADTDYAAWVDAAVSATAKLDLLILDGPITAEGARGVRAEFLVSMSTQAQNIGDVVYSTFDVKPAVGTTITNYPSTVVMGASSDPTFTAL